MGSGVDKDFLALRDLCFYAKEVVFL